MHAFLMAHACSRATASRLIACISFHFIYITFLCPAACEGRRYSALLVSLGLQQGSRGLCGAMLSVGEIIFQTSDLCLRRDKLQLQRADTGPLSAQSFICTAHSTCLKRSRTSSAFDPEALSSAANMTPSVGQFQAALQPQFTEISSLLRRLLQCGTCKCLSRRPFDTQVSCARTI